VRSGAPPCVTRACGVQHARRPRPECRQGEAANSGELRPVGDAGTGRLTPRRRKHRTHGASRAEGRKMPGESAAEMSQGELRSDILRATARSPGPKPRSVRPGERISTGNGPVTRARAKLLSPESVTKAHGHDGQGDVEGSDSAAGGTPRRKRRDERAGMACSGLWQSNVVALLRQRESNVRNVMRGACNSKHRRPPGQFSSPEKSGVAQRFIPRYPYKVIDSLHSKCYIASFSDDGELFVGGFQERRIRLYEVNNDWALRKDISARNLRWTITDCALSPEQRYLVYSTINPCVHLVDVGQSKEVQSIANMTEIHEELNFVGAHEPLSVQQGMFGLWSVCFSPDGRELVAGSSLGAVHVYDLKANKPTSMFRCHYDDVNAVAFADSSPHVMLSGSDDMLVKVIDRRTKLSVGYLPGHTEGITYIDSKGDGRYLITNGKDQKIKLWDIRRAMTSSQYKNGPGYRRRLHWVCPECPGRGGNLC